MIKISRRSLLLSYLQLLTAGHIYSVCGFCVPCLDGRSVDRFDERPVHIMSFITPSVHLIDRRNAIGVRSRVIATYLGKTLFLLHLLLHARFIMLSYIFDQCA